MIADTMQEGSAQSLDNISEIFDLNSLQTAIFISPTAVIMVLPLGTKDISQNFLLIIIKDTDEFLANVSKETMCWEKFFNFMIPDG